MSEKEKETGEIEERDGFIAIPDGSLYYKKYDIQKNQSALRCFLRYSVGESPVSLLNIRENPEKLEYESEEAMSLMLLVVSVRRHFASCSRTSDK